MNTNLSFKNDSQTSLTSVESGELSVSPCAVSLRGRISEDWADREFIESITSGIQRIVVFLNDFDRSCKDKLASLQHKLTVLEKTITFWENNCHYNESETQESKSEPEVKEIINN